MTVTQTSVRITNPTGLHARPAVKLAQLAAAFDANVQLRVGDGEWVKAKSTAKVMKLKARAQTILHFRADGQEAADALCALVAFVKRDFDEAPAADAPDGVAVIGGRAEQCAVTGDGGGEQLIRAEVASSGLIRGVVFKLASHSAVTEYRRKSADEEQNRLRSALDQAGRQLAGLGRDDVDAREIIAFQQALLEDEELLTSIVASVQKGVSAREAWRQTFDAEIHDYESGEDEYFRARAGDLRDLRDRVLLLLDGLFDETATQVPDDAIVVTEEMPPSLFLQLDWERLAGIVVRQGSRNSHTAMLARARSVPLLIKLQADLALVETGADAVLDAEKGILVLNPSATSLQSFQDRIAERQSELARLGRFLDKNAHDAHGVALKVYVNIDDPTLLRNLNIEHCDGVGLTRTEFLFHHRSALPDEEEQYRVYRTLLEWAQGKPVTVRTLDAGGDKPIAGLTPEGESNPFLGIRGVRLSLARPDVFKAQLRALARAAVHGRLKVMVPMVALPAEFEQARCLLQAEVNALQRAGLTAAMPDFGMMVEVPAAALTIADFDADFFSIGSNDLVQYTLAAGRDCADLADLQNPLHPAVMELIKRVAERGKQAGIEVSVCGEMAADVNCLAALLDAGVRVLSVPPAALAAVKAALIKLPGASV